MAKQYKLIDLPSTSTDNNANVTPTDWTKCAICQVETKEPTRCPAKSLRINKEIGYRTLAENLQAFSQMGYLPMDINIQRLNDGQGLAETLISHRAAWHVSCFGKVNRQKVERAHKRKLKDDSNESSPVKTRRKHDTHQRDACFFCDQPKDGAHTLHKAQTFLINRKVTQCATDLNDTKLLAKLSAGDMVAIDATYHTKYLVSLYNRHRLMTSIKDSNKNDATRSAEGIILAELVSFIEGSRDDKVAPVFKLSELTKMYSHRLKELGVEVPERVNSTRLKERILSIISDLTTQSHGRDVIFIFQADIGEAIKNAYSNDWDSDAIHLVRAANVVRREMFENTYTFTGSFESKCEEHVVPQSLMALVSMLMEGPNIKDQKCKSPAKVRAALSIAEIIMFNSVKRSHGSGLSVRHSNVHETPLPIYISMKLHAMMRQRQLIDIFHSLGLAISYDRYMQLSTNVGNTVCQRYEQENIICPPSLRKEVFSAGMVDNIDHNPSSRQAKDSFHGTGISIVQFPTPDKPGLVPASCVIDSDIPKLKSLLPLPAAYAQVPPSSLLNEHPHVPLLDGPVKAATNIIDDSTKKEHNWLKSIERLSLKPQLDKGDNVSWAAYHARQQPHIDSSLSYIALLPLFYESAHTVAMIRHAMDIVRTSVDHLNSGQTPIITMDQPLYAICKKIQWVIGGSYGEDRFVAMLGPLHTEMALLRLLGDWLVDSGWTSALTQANVCTSGRADAVLKGSHVTRSRYAHQVTAASLYLLQKEAYQEYVKTVIDDHQPLAFNDWMSSQKQQPQFFYWTTVLELECLMLQYIRSIREGNSPIYVQILGKLVPWFFCMGLTNYARWLPVHIRDMSMLATAHPDIHEEFMKGHFVVKKSEKLFSAMGMDQAHEQQNDLIKGVGGVIGLTENPSALHRWMVSGPEIARLVSEFECNFRGPLKGKDTRHHEQNTATQTEFLKNVRSLSDAIKEMGNPFTEDTGTLFALDTKNVMSEAVVEKMRNMKHMGQDAYDEFVEQRLLHQEKTITDTIQRPKHLLFSTPSNPKRKNNAKLNLTVLKNDSTLFSRMYISCQSRTGDLENFFRHENLSYPPSLSHGGNLRQCTKSDLLTSLNTSAEPSLVRPAVDVMIIDGAAMVHMLTPGVAKTFHAYATDVILRYLNDQLKHVNRLDVVWDMYISGSLKEAIRIARGSGTRKRVVSSSPIPGNWSGFLRVDENKDELFHFLARQISSMQTTGKVIISTRDTEVISSTPVNDPIMLSPCTHEEADTRVMLHVAHCVNQGHTKVCIRTVDTDLVVLAVATVNELNSREDSQHHMHELWLAFGTGKNFRYIPAHSIVTHIGPQQSRALPMMHALTGCDTVSSFCGKGKKSAWESWKVFPQVTDAFVTLANGPDSINDDVLAELERYIVVLYSRTCPHTTVNEARRYLFSQGTRALENVPPTQDALYQHIRRATYQAGHIWGQCLVPCPVYPDPSEWGWQSDGGHWLPHWTTLCDASKACKEFVSCGCNPNKGCSKLCKCNKANLPCTELCKCRGGCN